MTNGRPRTEWSSPQIVLTIVLALLAAQSAYANFNDATRAEIGANRTEIMVLKERVAVLVDRVREMERGRRDGGSR